MAHNEKQVRKLAATSIEEWGDEAHLMALLRAMNLRSQRDMNRAAMWEDVAALVAQIQTRPAKRRQH
jgi:hypothetical protein